MANDHKTQKEWNIYLTMAINFVSSEDSDETRVLNSKSYNVEIMMGIKVDEITQELFQSFLQRLLKS